MKSGCIIYLSTQIEGKNMSQVKSISLQNLLIDLQNPRYDPRINQREATITIVNEQGSKLVALADDIVNEGGLNPSELPMVMPSGDENTFIVMEGNRRLTALKLLLSPSLVSSLNLPDGIAKKLKALHEKAKDVLPTEVPCTVFESREEARHWVDLRHTGENGGVGIVPWDGIQTQRFRGSSPSLQAVEYARNSEYLDEATRNKLPKIAITNVERVLNTTEAREILGIDIRNNELIFRAPEEVVIPRLATIVSDIANKKKRVTHLDSREQRVEYAKEVVENPIEKANKAKSEAQKKSGTSTSDGTVKTGLSPKVLPAHRKTLIPKRLKLTIPVTRLNKIYDELQRLDVSAFVNSCAVLLRVFVELSIDEYAQKHGISLQKSIPTSSGEIREVEFSLREKLRTIADHFEANKIRTKDELRGVRSIITNKEHVLSVDSLNAYVHNKDFHPSDSDLKTTWDNLEAYMTGVWSS
jgi:hypothetical protein